jgi:hypothetical protein
LAARKYAIDAKESGAFKTFGENAWGVSASLGPDGYQGGYGARPNGKPGAQLADRNDGTLAPYGALGSLVFTPDESKAALKHYAGFEKLWGAYGLYDAYNIDRNWFSDWYIGIDKGITLAMIANYERGLIWDLFNRNTYVKNGLQEIGIMKQ